MEKKKQQLTKADVRGVVKKEIKKALNEQNERNLAVFATKQDLKNALDEQNKRNLTVFATKQDLREGLDNLEGRLLGEFNRNQTYLEKIYAKVNKWEQEDTMHIYQHKIIGDKITEHDKRIGKLEKAVV